MTLSRLTRMAAVAGMAISTMIMGCLPQDDPAAGEPAPSSDVDDGMSGGGDGDGTGVPPPGPGGEPAPAPAPGPDPEPEPVPAQLTANAGPDQTVDEAVLVTLAGGGQDSSGAGVTYSWAQTAGPPVTLSGQATATATFTAPNSSAALAFRLRVQSPNGTAEDDTAVTVRAAPILFVANLGGSIARFRADRAFDGNVAPLGLLAGANARLSSPMSVVPDGIGGILVTNAGADRVSGFLNALTITGDVTPERYVGGAASLLNGPQGAAYDSTNDLLYVSNFDSFPGSVNVYAQVSTPSFFGAVAPVRRIRSQGIQNSRDIELSASSELHVVNAGGQNITVFANAGSLDGLVNATRTINSNDFVTYGPILDACLDSGGRLLVVASGGKRVLVFNDAASLNGDVTPAGVLTVPGIGSLAGIVVDAAGTAYVTNPDLNEIYVYESIATRSGTVDADRIVSGDATGLSSPWHMCLVPR